MPKGIYPRKPRVPRPIADRFWPKVNRSGDCWEWTAHRTRTGYGMIGLPNSRTVERAHRVAWILTNGPIPVGMCVLHRCDNRACVRPDHLFLGTQADNVADMISKGRRHSMAGDAHPARRPGARIGERNGRSRLTADDVRRIRTMRGEGLEYRQIAAHFGVAVPTVQHIVSGKNWSHID